jgi:MscS family membrane protein
MIINRLFLIAFEQEIQKYVLELAIRLGLFLLGAALSPVIGRSLPHLIIRMLKYAQKYIEFDVTETYNNYVKPVRNSLMTTGSLLFIALCLNLLVNYEELYTFLGLFIYLFLSVSLAWFASKVAQRVIRGAVINLLQRQGREVNEVVLVFETLTNLLIIILAIVIFAQGLRLNLIALTASLGISGVAVAFAAQQALGRLIGTIELYLDRPYLPGEYIRVTFNPFKGDIYGRVESIGLRSTKIRTVATNTLIIVPNSMMAGMNIENITRGKKIMAMLCLDFGQPLTTGEKALVTRVIEETSQTFWGLNKANVRIEFCASVSQVGTQARVNFFLTGSSEDSINLRKRIVDLANDKIANTLSTYNLQFKVLEPIVYIDSPMSI